MEMFRGKVGRIWNVNLVQVWRAARLHQMDGEISSFEYLTNSFLNLRPPRR